LIGKGPRDEVYIGRPLGESSEVKKNIVAIKSRFRITFQKCHTPFVVMADVAMCDDGMRPRHRQRSNLLAAPTGKYASTLIANWTVSNSFLFIYLLIFGRIFQKSNFQNFHKNK